MFSVSGSEYLAPKTSWPCTCFSTGPWGWLAQQNAKIKSIMPIAGVRGGTKNWISGNEKMTIGVCKRDSMRSNPYNGSKVELFCDFDLQQHILHKSTDFNTTSMHKSAKHPRRKTIHNRAVA